MTNAIDHLHNALIIMRTDNKATIKGMVAKLTEQGFNSELWDTKSKALFIESIDKHRFDLAESALVSELDALKVDISKVIAEAGKAAFELGNLLLKARSACDTQQEFLDWVDDNFGIKKAWAFKLMKVSQVFTGEPWNTVSTSVLYTLQAQATDEQLIEARKFAEAGKLDISTLKALLNPPVPVVKPAAEETPKAQEATQNALMSIETKEVGQALPAATEAHSEPLTAPEVAPVESSSEPDTSALLQQVADLTATVNKLTEQLAEAQKPRIQTASGMPMLRQFNSPLMHVRLGLSQQESQSKETILEAFRELCKAGYGRTHEAWPLLDEARHNLIHAIEEVAA